jgi:Ca2+-binding RTX toxin-like protein
MPLDASATLLAAPSATGQEVEGPGDDADGVGVWHTMGHTGETYVATVDDDLIEGGKGADRVFVRGGEDIVFAGEGDDYVEAIGGDGKDVLHGQDGDDHLLVISEGKLNELQGGDGNDLIQAYAPWSVILGGEGDDYFVLDERSIGARISDGEGNNSLLVLSDVDLKYTQDGDDLYIHLNEDLDYQHDQDIVWLDFFGQKGNSVNGLSAAEIGALVEDPDDCDPGCCAHMPETVEALLV